MIANVNPPRGEYNDAQADLGAIVVAWNKRARVDPEALTIACLGLAPNAHQRMVPSDVLKRLEPLVGCYSVYHEVTVHGTLDTISLLRGRRPSGICVIIT